MRTAIIFTGALRTIRKTIRYFKENVLLANQTSANQTGANQTGANETTASQTVASQSPDIFICVQNDSPQRSEDWNLWFRDEMGPTVRSVEWFSLEQHSEWVTHRETQLNHIYLDEGWKRYLRTSGSMIEYFQLQLAYMKMCHYEQLHQIKYDYIVRARTDSIYAKPVDFHWLQWSTEDIAARLARITVILQQSPIELTRKNILTYFMTTIISDDLIPNIPQMMVEMMVEMCPSETETILQSDLTPTALRTYIHEGRYILTIRKNNLYIVRRNLFYLIPSLGTMYGFLRSPVADDYWFNAECQFRSACYHSCVTIFEYSSLFEEKSLEFSGWNHSDFFDEEGNPIHSRMLYCIVRK